MIIWLASYPRSGNTMLRTMLWRVYGARSYSKYNDKTDIGSSPETAAAVGHADYAGDWPEAKARMAAAPEIYFVKTHEAPEDDAPAIYVVRDGLDALVSNRHYWKDFNQVEQSLETLITGLATPFPSWGAHLDSWQPLTRQRTLLLRYEDLLKTPDEQLDKITALTGQPRQQPWVNDFGSLQKVNPKFFRSGQTKVNQREISPDTRGLFLGLHGDWMQSLGYHAETSAPSPFLVRQLLERPAVRGDRSSPAAASLQIHIDDLLRQLNALAAVSQEQAAYIKTLEGERLALRKQLAASPSPNR